MQVTLIQGHASVLTSASGTVRENRVGLHKDINEKTLMRGKMVMRQKALLTNYVIWKDKRTVYALSNCHGRVELVETGKKDYKTKMALPVFKLDIFRNTI